VKLRLALYGLGIATLLTLAVGATVLMRADPALPYDRAADNGATLIKGVLALGIVGLVAAALNELP
jgi:hypothetical protein